MLFRSSGLSFQGKVPQYKLRPAEGSLFDEPIALRTGEFRETCATCGSRLTCNGCSNCGACERTAVCREVAAYAAENDTQMDTL